MRSLKIRNEMALVVALTVVLSLVSKVLPQMPFGGSISLRMIPLLVFAFRRGARAGCLAGALYGVVDFLLDPYIVHPLQIVLDYPLAHAALGMAGLLTPIKEGQLGQEWGDLKSQLDRGTWARLVAGSMLAGAARWSIHFVSGMVFFSQYAPPDQPVWIYSALYNASYIVPEVILSIFFLGLTRRILYI